MNPIYIPNFSDVPIDYFLNEITWNRYTETRQETFMSDPIMSYTYGSGGGKRTYVSVPFNPYVQDVMFEINDYLDKNYSWSGMNGCFLNRYDDDRQHLGWHADNFDKMDHKTCVAVLSFGESREIWWRKFGEKGVVPEEQRQLLESGSLFLMPPGMQYTHEHRIPKGSKKMGPRVSLTYRRFLA